MFDTLVVPMDGSQLAERALPYAIRMSQPKKARLVLTRAALVPPSRSLDGAEWQGKQAQAVQEALDYLKDMAESVSGQVSAVGISAPYGKPVDAILKTIQADGADGVVIATHGRTA